MKLAVTGKGGTGKTTIAGILAWYFRNDGYRVLAVDADPDANLASAIGIPPDLTASLLPISMRRELIRERTGAEPGEFGQMFKMNPAVSDIPDDYSIDFEGIRLLVMGAVRKGGGGCACPENVLTFFKSREVLDYVQGEDLMTPGTPLCAGCPMETTLRLAMKIFGRDTFLFGCAGCAGSLICSSGLQSTMKNPTNHHNAI